MKITKTQLKQIIKEELTKVLENKGPSAEDYRDKIVGFREILDEIPIRSPQMKYMENGIKMAIEDIFDFIKDPEVRDGVAQIVKSELGPEFLPAPDELDLEEEIHKMLDAGKEEAYKALGDDDEAIEQAGEYVDDVDGVKDLYPNAYAWWNENYGTYAANDMIEDWMAENGYSM